VGEPAQFEAVLLAEMGYVLETQQKPLASTTWRSRSGTRRPPDAVGEGRRQIPAPPTPGRATAERLCFKIAQGKRAYGKGQNAGRKPRKL
jgi:hypothetical protein